MTPTYILDVKSLYTSISKVEWKKCEIITRKLSKSNSDYKGHHNLYTG